MFGCSTIGLVLMGCSVEGHFHFQAQSDSIASELVSDVWVL